ncbi:hypothetical protein BDFB_014888 [Asbolus verrucosus]|nr:hypothetical protein BDFB_014888 [Asbolus verrucosus]
MQTLKV